MKVLLVYPNIVESPKDISIGLGIVAALLKKNKHSVELLDNTFGLSEEEIIEKVRMFDPELVAVTAASNDLERAKEICLLIKREKDIMVVCGGYHATVAPEDILKEECFDAAAIGEAEYSLLKLVESIEKKEVDYSIENLWFKGHEKNEVGELKQELDELPFANREIFEYQKYINANRGLATFMSSKGCPFSCSYCINKVLIDKYEGKGKFLRFRSVESVLKEIKEVLSKYKVKEIEFYDDTFTLDKSRLKEFCERYEKEIKLPFYVNARVNAVTREDFELLKRAGCVRVSIGIEAGDEKIRNGVLKRNQSDEKIIETFKNAKEVGLKTYAFNMIGIPQENYESIQKTIDLNRKIQPDYVGVSIFNAYKGTELYRYCEENNLLCGLGSESYFQSSNVIHPRFSVMELKKIRDAFGFEVYKKSNLKRACIDLVDKKLARVALYGRLKSLLIEKGVRRIIEK